MKLLATISNSVGSGLITLAVAIGSLSIFTLTREWTLSVGVTLSDITTLLFLASAAYQRSSQLFSVKKKNTVQLNFKPIQN